MSAALPGLLRLRRRTPRRRRDAAPGQRLQGRRAGRELLRAGRRAQADCTCRSSAASRWCASANSTRFCRGWPSAASTRSWSPAPCGRFRRSGRRFRRLQIVVSIDGLQPEHDVRRTPATYDRILKHIAGQQITVHCTVTRQQVQRDGYLEEFLALLVGEPRTCARSGSACTRRRSAKSPPESSRRTTDARRAALMHLRALFPKLHMPEGLMKVYAAPSSPDDCVFAQTTPCVSADFKHRSRRASLAAIRTAPVRLHRLGGPRRRRRVTACRAVFAWAPSSRTSLRVGRRVHQMRARAPAAGAASLRLWRSRFLRHHVRRRPAGSRQRRQPGAQGDRAALRLQGIARRDRAQQEREHHRPDRRRRVQDDRAVGDPADAHGAPRRADQEPDPGRNRARRQRHRAAGRRRSSRASRPTPPRKSSSS